MKKLIYVLYLMVVVFVLTEIVLRYRSVCDTYSEGIGGKYLSMYGVTNPSVYHLHKPHNNYTPPNIDFAYPYFTNRFGVREKDYSAKTDSNIRIFTCGDSFSEGMGAPYDSTWPHLLQKYLNQDSVGTEVFNTGVAGNDPVYDYVFYRDSLKQFKPDYLIVPLNASDFTDYLIRGGFERINSNGTETYRSGPWYEFVYRCSRLFRWYMNESGRWPYRGIFSSKQELLNNIDSAAKNFETVIDSFTTTAASDSTKIIVLFYLTPSEIIWQDTFVSKMDDAYRQLEQRFTARHIPCINVRSRLRKFFSNKKTAEFTYPKDMHYNAIGYNEMALAIAEDIKQQNLLKK